MDADATPSQLDVPVRVHRQMRKRVGPALHEIQDIQSVLDGLERSGTATASVPIVGQGQQLVQALTDRLKPGRAEGIEKFGAGHGITRAQGTSPGDLGRFGPQVKVAGDRLRS